MVPRSPVSVKFHLKSQIEPVFSVHFPVPKNQSSLSDAQRHPLGTEIELYTVIHDTGIVQGSSTCKYPWLAVNVPRAALSLMFQRDTNNCKASTWLNSKTTFFSWLK